MRRILIVGVASSVLLAGIVVVSQPAFAATSCNGTLTGNLPALTVPPGADCRVHDATVSGNVRVQKGAQLHMDIVTVQGSVIGSHPAFIELGRDFSGALGPVQIAGRFVDIGDQTGVVLCQTTVGGAVVVSKGAAPWIGDPEVDEIFGPACVGNTFRSSLSVTNTASPGINFVVEDNTVTGSVVLSGNSASSVVVEGNSIGGSLSCSGNTPPPTNLDGATPAPNSVQGTETGQCTGL